MEETSREVFDLSGTWTFQPNGGPVSEISVPGFWESQGHLTLDGEATYSTTFHLEQRPRYATLDFGAVADLCGVMLNDEPIGGHEDGFTPFRFDVSHLLVQGVNRLAVEVTDPPAGSDLHLQTVQGKQGWANRFFPSPPSVYITLGGIWQPCRLLTHGPLFVSDMSCDLDPEEPVITVLVENRSDEEQSAVITVVAFGHLLVHEESVPPRATVNKGFVFAGRDVPRWSPASPALHEIAARVTASGLPSDEARIRTGLRSFVREGDDFLLNGETYRMRSALHQGFWPTGIYAADEDLIELDVSLALGVGLNTLRTHLKVFEPQWLDAADRLGLLLQCDTPVGEPLDAKHVSPDSEFGKRTLRALEAQIRRDRSRPSILMWTLMNEVGLSNEGLVASDGYKALVKEMAKIARALDPRRPVVENDWIWQEGELVASDLRSPHWYGRGTASFSAVTGKRLGEAELGKGPLYVTEFGEWGLPSQNEGDVPDRQGRPADDSFWDNAGQISALIKRSGWPGTVDELIDASQQYQGWVDRIHAERFRTSNVVKGFCLTEWTDVPIELNGLVSFRREVKLSVEAFRPAVADVCPILLLDRYVFAPGEPVVAMVFISNWSARNLAPGIARVSLGDGVAEVAYPEISAGRVVELGEVSLSAPDRGDHELRIETKEVGAAYPLTVLAPPSAGIRESISLIEGDAELTTSKPIIRVGASGEDVKPIPTNWGPTPLIFSDHASLNGPRLLTHELYHCYPIAALDQAHGAVGVLVPPPIDAYGAVAGAPDGEAFCFLPITGGVERNSVFELVILNMLAEMI